MGDLTKDFSRHELACKGENCCGHSAPVDRVLVDSLQTLRDLVGKPLTINSGFRCNRHNARVTDSASNSSHCIGLAADVDTPKTSMPRHVTPLAESDVLEIYKRLGIQPSGHPQRETTQPTPPPKPVKAEQQGVWIRLSSSSKPLPKPSK
jgi:hypothetical protein